MFAMLNSQNRLLNFPSMLAMACVASPLSKDTAAHTKTTGRFPERPPETPERLESQIIQREDCVSDYQGWVDFGRRSTN
uniref:Uncharacterized protein n=1 Tax=Cyprinus carpio TaxID=7962 RepID=A0A8C1TLB9_CYPCA